MTLSSQPYLLSVGDTGIGHHVWLPSSFKYPTVLRSHLFLFILFVFRYVWIEDTFFPHEHSVPECYLFTSHLCISALISYFFPFGNRGWIQGLMQVSLHSSIELPPALPLQDVGLLTNPRAWIYSKWLFVILHIVIKCKNKTQKQLKGEWAHFGSDFVGTVLHGGRSWGQLVKGDECWSSTGFVLCTQPGTLAHGMAPDTSGWIFGFSWPNQENPHRCASWLSTQQSQILQVHYSNHRSMCS